MKSTQGFTLIELLIVIAIIGILAAVLIPNLLGARTKANISAAQSFIRNTVTAVETNRDTVNSKLTDGGYGTGAEPTLPAGTPADATGTAPCNTVQGKAAATIPAGVNTCVVSYGGQDNFVVNLEMKDGNLYAYDGSDIKKVVSAVTAP